VWHRGYIASSLEVKGQCHSNPKSGLFMAINLLLIYSTTIPYNIADLQTKDMDNYM